MKTTLSDGQLEAELYRISAMLNALGELMMFCDRESSIDEKRFHVGVGELMNMLSREVEGIGFRGDNDHVSDE